MNAVFLLPALPKDPRTGGEIYISHLLRGLRDRGWEIDVLFLPDIHSRTPLAGSRAFYRLLKDYRGEARVLVYDTWLYRWLWPVMALVRARTSFKLISFSQLCYWDTYASSRARGFHRILTWAAQLPAHRNIAVSQTILRQDLAPFSRASHGRVVYPGCDWADAPLPQADPDGVPPQIVSVANYAERKGFHVLIDALARVKQQAPELGGQLTLRLVGNLDFGPAYVARLRQQVASAGLSENVVFDGWKSRDELSRLFGASQLFALASSSEGFGMVVAEAMLHGLPVILSDFAVARELLGDEQDTGYIVDRGDADGFARAMCDYFTARDRIRMGRCARARAQNLVTSWDRVAEQFHRILAETSAIS